MLFQYSKVPDAEFEGLEVTLQAGEHHVNFVFPVDPEADPFADLERIGQEALYTFAQHLAGMGFIRGAEKGGAFVEERF